MFTGDCRQGRRAAVGVADAAGLGRTGQPASGGAGVGDQASVGDRLGEDRLVEQPVEEQAAAARAAAVEAEGELVEVGIEVLASDRTLVGAQQPAL